MENPEAPPREKTRARASSAIIVVDLVRVSPPLIFWSVVIRPRVRVSSSSSSTSSSSWSLGARAEEEDLAVCLFFGGRGLASLLWFVVPSFRRSLPRWLPRITRC